jgi:hypothetical protein
VSVVDPHSHFAVPAVADNPDPLSRTALMNEHSFSRRDQ